jgi:hypothetical protein
LEKENRCLRKRLKQLEKSSHIYEDLKLSEDIEEEVKVKPKKSSCTSCGEGEIKVIMDFEDKYIVACTDCHFKKSIKK